MLRLKVELAEVLNVLVKNIQEVSESHLDKMEDMEMHAPEEKKYMSEAFTESLIGKIFYEAKALLNNSRYKDFAKIYIYPDIGMAKIEITIGTLDMTSTALNSLEMTYDTVLNINFLYNPDVLHFLFLVLRNI